MSTSPEPAVPVEPGAVAAAGVEATQEVQASDTLPQEGVLDQEAQEEDEAPRPRLAFPPRPPQPTVHAEEADDSEDDGLDDLVREEEEEAGSARASTSGSEDEGEAYVPATESAAAKIPKFKKNKKSKKSRDDDGEDDVGTNGEKSKKTKKSKKSKDVVEEDDAEDEDAGPALDEGTLRRMALEERIDNIGKSERKVKRKRKDEEDVADMYHEEVCNRLRERMERAAEKDRVSHENRLPATAKLAMLEDVMAVLRNVRMFQAIVDSRLLEAVSSWLEPMRPSGSLPAEGIQKAIFEVLPRMELDAQTLKETYLGRVVLFYTKAPRVQGSIKRQADTLVQNWSRPILRRPADLHTRQIMTVNDLDLVTQTEDAEVGGMGVGGDGEGEAGTPGPRSQTQSRAGSQKPKQRRVDWTERAQNNTTTKGTRLEKAQDYQYQIAPESQAKGKDRERDEHMRRIQMDNMRFNKFARQMRGGKAQR